MNKSIDQLELELTRLVMKRRNCSYLEIKKLDQKIKRLKTKLKEVNKQ